MENDLVFQECDNMPLWCKCGCGTFERLFTHEAQENNKKMRGAYRVFANCGHRDKYVKTQVKNLKRA